MPVQSRVEGHLLLDPTADEAYEEDGGLLLAYMPQASLVSLSHMQIGASLLRLPFTGTFTSGKCQLSYLHMHWKLWSSRGLPNNSLRYPSEAI